MNTLLKILKDQGGQFMSGFAGGIAGGLDQMSKMKAQKDMADRMKAAQVPQPDMPQPGGVLRNRFLPQPSVSPVPDLNELIGLPNIGGWFK